MLPCPNESNIDTSIDESKSKSKLKTEYIFSLYSLSYYVNWLDFFFSPAFMEKYKSFFFYIWTFVSIYLHLTFNYISYRHKSSFFLFCVSFVCWWISIWKKGIVFDLLFFLNMFFNNIFINQGKSIQAL